MSVDPSAIKPPDVPTAVLSKRSQSVRRVPPVRLATTPTDVGTVDPVTQNVLRRSYRSSPTCLRRRHGHLRRPFGCLPPIRRARPAAAPPGELPASDPPVPLPPWPRIP